MKNKLVSTNNIKTFYKKDKENVNNKIYNKDEIIEKSCECIKNTGSYIIYYKNYISLKISRKALENFKNANILPLDFDYNEFLVDSIDDLNFIEGNEDYVFKRDLANKIKENILNGKIYELFLILENVQRNEDGLSCIAIQNTCLLYNILT